MISKTQLLFIFVVLATSKSSLVEFPCKPPEFNSYPFCNTSLSIQDRALSLISLLSLQEKLTQLSNNASAIPRLGIPAYQWWSESLHGIAPNGPGVIFDHSSVVKAATLFPNVILTAAAFNRSLWFDIASSVAVEARAMYNVGQAGLTFWAPNINVFRDPRWGRGQETPGEDPLVVSAYGVEYVKGFQGGGFNRQDCGFEVDSELGGKRVLREYGGYDDEESLMVSACCKHFTAYDLEKWGNFSRYSFNAVVSEQDLEDTYQPPFRSCIQDGKASCLMCSYNAVNGVPACARGDMLNKARDDWGFKGYITSDCDAVATIFEYQNYTNSREDAVADALKAGMDINCGTFLLRNTRAAIDQGKVQEEDINRALFNLFSVQLRLGMFDGDPKKQQFGYLGPQHVCTSQHRLLALEAARQGIVLLKNRNNFLPLDKKLVSSLAVIGPLANDGSNLGGGYSGIPCNPKSLFEGIKVYIKTATYAAGCLGVPCDSDVGFDEAVLKAKEADLVILVAGIDLTQETEDLDRISLLLPGKQMALVDTMAAVGKPLVLVLVGGGPLDVSFAEKDPRIVSILWIGYPGEAGSTALSEIIFGDYNPGGRLPMTWYPESFTEVAMSDMNMRPDPSRGYPGRTYRFYSGNKIYEFGDGLSYTNFTYKFMSVPRRLNLFGLLTPVANLNILQQKGAKVNYVYVDEVASCQSLIFYVNISVMNVGDMDGSHVVMLFARLPKVADGTPEKQLIEFLRVHTNAYDSNETSILIDPCRHLSFADVYGKRILPLGNHVLMIGDLEHSISVVV